MVNFCLVTRILATWAVVASGQHHQTAPAISPEGPPSSSVDCTNLILKMVDCMWFLSNDSNETKPEDSCCAGFKEVLDTDSDCICEALKTSVVMGIDLNMTKAMALSSDCGVSSYSLSNCYAYSPPVTAPPPKPKNPPVPPPTANPPVPATPSPANSRADNMSSSLAVLFSVAVATFFYVLE